MSLKFHGLIWFVCGGGGGREVILRNDVCTAPTEGQLAALSLSRALSTTYCCR